MLNWKHLIIGGLVIGLTGFYAGLKTKKDDDTTHGVYPILPIYDKQFRQREIQKQNDQIIQREEEEEDDYVPYVPPRRRMPSIPSCPPIDFPHPPHFPHHPH